MHVSIPTLLSIYEWGDVMGISPWELAQIGEGFPTVNHAQCGHVVFRYAWQQDYLCREELAHTIAKAEEAVAEQLNFWPAPKWITNEVQPYPRPHNRMLYGYAGTPRGQWKALQVNWGKVQGGGLMARTLISAAGAVVMSDNDGDTINDRFTVTVATTITDPDEIAIYYAAADRNSEPLEEVWRIRPVNVVISGGNAVITGHPSLLVKPDLESVVDPLILDVTVATNFVTTVEVYRLYLDTTSTVADPAQGTALWEDPDCEIPPCSSSWLPLCQIPRNAEMGMIAVDFWQGNTFCPPQDREPDRVNLNYVAGEPLVNGRMSRAMADVVAHLTTAWLPVDKCGCERADRIIAYWRAIEAVDTKGVVPITLKQLDNNPFGVQRGALWAWQRVEQLRQQWASLA